MADTEQPGEQTREDEAAIGDLLAEQQVQGITRIFCGRHAGDRAARRPGPRFGPVVRRGSQVQCPQRGGLQCFAVGQQPVAILHRGAVGPLRRRARAGRGVRAASAGCQQPVDEETPCGEAETVAGGVQRALDQERAVVVQVQRFGPGILRQQGLDARLRGPRQFLRAGQTAVERAPFQRRIAFEQFLQQGQTGRLMRRSGGCQPRMPRHLLLQPDIGRGRVSQPQGQRHLALALQQQQLPTGHRQADVGVGGRSGRGHFVTTEQRPQRRQAACHRRGRRRCGRRLQQVLHARPAYVAEFVLGRDQRVAVQSQSAHGRHLRGADDQVVLHPEDDVLAVRILARDEGRAARQHRVGHHAGVASSHQVQGLGQRRVRTHAQHLVAIEVQQAAGKAVQLALHRAAQRQEGDQQRGGGIVLAAVERARQLFLRHLAQPRHRGLEEGMHAAQVIVHGGIAPRRGHLAARRCLQGRGVQRMVQRAARRRDRSR